jgi:PEGA domain
MHNCGGKSVHDQSSEIERLSTEVASLKLELATLVSALREHQSPTPRPPAAPRAFRKPEPPSRPSPAPAAIVVLLATSLLSWQLITGPRADGTTDARPAMAETARGVGQPRNAAPRPVIESAPTEPPLTPLVKPTVYKGTLSVSADRPGARVYVNRREVGVAPVRVPNLKAGAHLVWIEHEGFRRWTRVITVPAERVTRVSADLEPVE